VLQGLKITKVDGASTLAAFISRFGVALAFPMPGWMSRAPASATLPRARCLVRVLSSYEVMKARTDLSHGHPRPISLPQDVREVTELLDNTRRIPCGTSAMLAVGIGAPRPSYGCVSS